MARTIRKYPNRRLYDTETGKFIKLADLRDIVAGGDDVQVVEKSSGEDITRPMLLQAITEAEAEGHPILSQRLLTDLIRLHDHPMRDYLTPYLERGVTLFVRHVEQVQSQVRNLMDAGSLQNWQNFWQDSLSWWKPRKRDDDRTDTDSKR